MIPNKIGKRRFKGADILPPGIVLKPMIPVEITIEIIPIINPYFH
jgi:hypothetical protein